MLSAAHGPEIAALFGVGSDAVLTGPVAAGHMGRVWRLDTEVGSFAVKEPFEAIPDQEAERDGAYQDAFRGGGVPTPALVRTTAGAVLGRVAGNQVRLFEFVEVLAPHRRLDPAAVGELLATIHRTVLHTSEPVHEWYVDPVGEAAWSGLLERLRSRDAPFVHRFEDLLPDLLIAETFLRRPTYTQVCHLDLWADNLLRTAAGGLVVLDWEDAGAGSPDHELGMVLYEFGAGEPERMHTLYDAYRIAGGQGRIREPADLTQLVAQTFHIAHKAGEEWLASGTDEDRTAAEAWAAEFLDDPVTPERIDQILAALA